MTSHSRNNRDWSSPWRLPGALQIIGCLCEAGDRMHSHEAALNMLIVRDLRRTPGNFVRVELFIIRATGNKTNHSRLCFSAWFATHAFALRLLFLSLNIGLFLKNKSSMHGVYFERRLLHLFVQGHWIHSIVWPVVWEKIHRIKFILILL